MHHSRQWARGVVVTAAAAAVMVATACSNSGTSNAGKSDTSSSPSATASKAATSGASSSGAIDVGFAASFTGTDGFPAIQQAAEAAAKYVNAHGGLAGKHLNLITCDMKYDNQSSQECGQQFANDARMPFAIMALTFTGASFYAAMSAAHKPVLGGIGVTPADNSPSDTFFFWPGSDFYDGVADAIKHEGWKSVAWINEDNPSAVAGTAKVKAELAGAGVQIKTTTIPTTAADVTPQIASAGIANADGTVIISSSCPHIATAMQGLNIKPKAVLAANSCLTTANIAANPTFYDGWLLVAPLKLAAAGAGTDPDTTTFLQGWKQYGPGGEPGTFAEIGWGPVLTAQNIFRNATSVTSASALSALRTFKGPAVMGPSTISCPGPAPTTATCTTELLDYKITNGKLVPIKL